jgi:hypothetical protein
MTLGVRFGSSHILTVHDASMSRDMVNYDAFMNRIISQQADSATKFLRGISSSGPDRSAVDQLEDVVPHVNLLSLGNQTLHLGVVLFSPGPYRA